LVDYLPAIEMISLLIGNLHLYLVFELLSATSLLTNKSL
jgi:hypothetical protein